MNENILDKKLYEMAKKDADLKYKVPSAYKSMYIQKKYKQLGGRYKNKKRNQASTDRWRTEQWVVVSEYLNGNKKIVCGTSEIKNKVCRPLKRINKDTPITLPELLKIHSKKDLLTLANKKRNDMKGRVMWKTLKFIPSK
tara:strand:- start:1476 stop:1895 length:420 start_codon:yes stop_codon:yes gene_type:complete